jgi:hypothetical protein
MLSASDHPTMLFGDVLLQAAHFRFEASRAFKDVTSSYEQGNAHFLA